MRERGDGARFLLESRDGRRIGREPRRQNLDRDVAAEPRVARAIDLAHPARAERGENLVGPESRARVQQSERPLSLSKGGILALGLSG